MKKIIFVVVNMFVVASLLTACTGKLWKKNEYSEEFQQVLMTENKDKIVIIGQKYHYIFPTDNVTKNLLTWQNTNNIRMYLSKFNVANNIVSGSYTLSIDKNKVSEKQQEWLKNNGFNVRSAHKKQDEDFYYSSKIQGNRYLANNNVLINKFSKQLSKKYTVAITEDFSGLDKASRKIATPVAIAADGTLFVGAVALMTVVVPVAYVAAAPVWLVGCVAMGDKKCQANNANK